jgi:hypothetical protein
MFTIKCAFNDYAVTLSLMNIGVGMLIFASGFRIFERPIQA